ncbi:hypothetical protein J2127_001210 [Methanococcus voltae]|uniref:COG1361 S-layer family protein n=1 Tax=Methanococcus voltae TaxID=2188 RepID=UPI001AE816F2|nr:COG1361 S-layer family protein [Methanococcus voltae]MBP2144041.1 hypothetical protein [Methanococcus voltae]
MNNKILKLSLLGLILTLTAISGVSALQIDDPQYNPSVIKPGDDADIWIKFTNDEGNDRIVKNLIVELEDGYPIEIKQTNPTKGIYTISNLNKGESDLAHFKINIDKNAQTNDFKIKVKYTYDIYDDVDDKYPTHESREREYYLPVKGEADFELTSEDVQLIPASNMEYPIIIKNVGTGIAKDIDVLVGSSAYINPVGGVKYNVKVLEPFGSTEVVLNLHADSKTTEGSYIVPVTLVWTDEDGTKHNETIEFGVIVEGDVNLGISNVITEPNEIKPGTNYIKLSVDITNNGHGEAKNINLNLKTSEPFSDSGSNVNFKNVGILNSGDTKTAIFYVDLNKHADAQTYDIPLEITYLDAYNKEHVENENVTVLVKTKPELEILNNDFTIYAGRQTEILVTLKNVGTEKAEKVKITAIKNSAQPFDYEEKTDDIGTLEILENGTGRLVIDTEASAAIKDYLINLEVRSVGDHELGDEDVYVSQKTLKVHVQKPAGSYLLPILVVVVVLAGGVYYLKVYRPKKKSKSEDN